MNVQYKIEHISKTKNCNKKKSGTKKSVSEHCASFGTKQFFLAKCLRNISKTKNCIDRKVDISFVTEHYATFWNKKWKRLLQVQLQEKNFSTDSGLGTPDLLVESEGPIHSATTVFNKIEAGDLTLHKLLWVLAIFNLDQSFQTTGLTALNLNVLSIRIACL